MKIDFARTKRELTRLLKDRLSVFASKHQNVAIKSIGFWGLSFPKIAKVLLETTDDIAVFGNRGECDYEYVPNEYGGIEFDWWPDLYELKENDRYEIALAKEWAIDPDLLAGDDAINVPLFALLKTVLDEVSLKGLKVTKDLQLGVAIGSHWLEARWPIDASPKTSELIQHLATEWQMSEAGLRPKISTTTDLLKCRRLIIEAGGSSMAFSPDGRRLISLGTDGTMHFWNASSGKEIRAFECGDSQMVVSRDAKLAATFNMEECLTIWRLDEAKSLGKLAGHDPWVSAAAFSPDGTQIASADEGGTVRLWSVKSRKLKAILAKDLRILGQLAFSPDGETVAWVSNDGDQSIMLWNLSNERGTPVPMKHELWPKSGAFSPDGSLIATGSSERINLWNIANGRIQFSFELDSDLADCIAFSPTAPILAGAGQDRAIVFLNTVTGEKLQTVANPGNHHTVRSLAFSPDGGVLAASHSDGTIDLWDMSCLCPSARG